jgi:dGTP triphosphohydrolase
VRAPLLIAEDAAALELRRWQGPAAYPRTEMQLDRDRILYSSAFKRLAHVTQVTASEPGSTE